MHELPIRDSHKVTQLVAGLPYPQMAQAIISGNVEGRVFVDNPEDPSVALVWEIKSNLFLAGEPSQATVRGLARVFSELVVPDGERTMRPMRHLQYFPDAWVSHIPSILSLRPPMPDPRVVYTMSNPADTLSWLEAMQGQSLPDGCRVVPADMRLLESPVEHVEDVRSEILGQWSSVEQFCEEGFGFCTVLGDVITSWCLTEYHTDHGCSIGVETVDRFRKRGHGTESARATVGECLRRGLEVHWDAWKSNVASLKLAEKAGFDAHHEYQVFFFWNNRLDNLLCNAHIALNKKNDLATAADRYSEVFLDYGRPMMPMNKGSFWLRTPRGRGVQLCNAARAELALGKRGNAKAYMKLLGEQKLPADELSGLKAAPEYAHLWHELGGN